MGSLNQLRTWQTFLLALSAGLSGCSLRSPENQVVTVNLPPEAPTSANRSAHLRSGASTQTGSSPRSVGDFSCLGLVVSGSGIAADSRMGCGAGSPAPGLLGGLISVVNGGSIDVTVPRGSQRTIRIFAVQSQVGCPSADQLLAQGPKGFGRFYQVGQVVADVFTDTTVNVRASFDPFHPVLAFPDCTAFRSGGGPSRALVQAATFNAHPVAMKVLGAGACGSSVRPCLNAVLTIGAPFMVASGPYPGYALAPTGARFNLSFETLESSETGN